MLRIKHIPDGDALYEKMLTAGGFRDELRGLGVEFSPDVMSPDYLLIGHKQFLKMPRSYAEGTIPAIIHGTYDYGQVHFAIREHLDSDNVKAILQGSRLTSLAEQNQPWKDSIRHGMLIASFGIGNIWQPPPLTRKGFEKVHIWGGFACYAAMSEAFRTIPQPIPENRPFDIHCVINTKYAGTILETHRQAAIDAVLEYQKNDYATVCFGRSSGDMRSMAPCDYAAMMRRSKAVISPWGWGEWCVRDYEAILAGCLVIKRRTDFSEEMHDGNEVFASQIIDWSGSPISREAILQKFSDHRARISAYHLVKKAGEPKHMAKLFKEIVDKL